MFGEGPGESDEANKHKGSDLLPQDPDVATGNSV
jgi:hypothetical protein